METIKRTKITYKGSPINLIELNGKNYLQLTQDSLKALIMDSKEGVLLTKIFSKIPIRFSGQGEG